MAEGLQTNQCCCPGDSSSESSSAIFCECNAIQLELTLCPPLTLARLDALIALAASIGESFSDASGFSVSLIQSCYAEDTLGQLQDSMKVAVRFICCGEPNALPSESLAHCYYGAQGEDPPEGKVPLDVLIEAWCDDNSDLVCSCDHQELANCTSVPYSLSCHFSDPVVTVPYTEMTLKTVEECCLDDDPREVVV